MTNSTAIETVAIPFVVFDQEFEEMFICNPSDQWDIKRLERILRLYKDDAKQSFHEILERVVKSLYGFSFQDLSVHDRHRGIKHVRHVVLYCLYKYGKYSLARSGIFVDRGHCTCLNSIGVIDSALEGYDNEQLKYHYAIVSKLNELGAI